ncbi:UNVERIFIED_CONTAM: hypothetical protein GTU68_025506 [Idotea baltica]|nr:hypothetical protein [Idotea baltica]
MRCAARTTCSCAHRPVPEKRRACLAPSWTPASRVTGKCSCCNRGVSLLGRQPVARRRNADQPSGKKSAIRYASIRSALGRHASRS